MKNKILICNGTSGISAGAESVGELFSAGLKQHNLEDQYDVVMTGDRGLFRDVLVDIVSPDAERITYEYVKPEDVPGIVEEHLVKGGTGQKTAGGRRLPGIFCKSNPNRPGQLRRNRSHEH